MARRHTRFALRGVTFEGVDLPGATIDAWEDDAGFAQWSARVVTRLRISAEAGNLAGETADGRVFSGPVVVADRQVTAGGRTETLIEFHGAGELTVRDRDEA
jgi:hypothetical protein